MARFMGSQAMWAWDDAEAGSGERPAIDSQIRPRSGSIPKLWNDEIDGEITGPTDINALARRSPARASLQVMTGARAGEVIALDAGSERVIGRSRSADICIAEDGVSRVHCRLVIADGAASIQDLDSRNGTLVNGVRVSSAPLCAGDRIQLGTLVLQFAFVDETEETLARHLFDASTRDPLTRAYNRRYFMQRLDAELSYARRHRTGLGVLMLDLDHFKAINDSAGHAAGDAVLRGVVKELERTVRTEDLLTRYGGEEFAILVRVGSFDELERFAERIRERIEAARIELDGRALRVTVSVGIAELAECSDATGDDLLGIADRRLYRAKLLGRNRVCKG